MQLEHIDYPTVTLRSNASPVRLIDGDCPEAVETGKLQHLLDVGCPWHRQHRVRSARRDAGCAKLHQFGVLSDLMVSSSP